MFDYDKWQEIFATIRKNKLRTGLTAAGVFWGIFMLIFMMGMGDGLEKGVMKEFGGRSTNSLYVWPERTSIAYKGLPVGRGFGFTVDDINAIDENIDGIEILAPRFMRHNAAVSYQSKNDKFHVRGEWAGIQKVEALAMQEGRFLNALDEKNKRKVAVLGRIVKETLFGEESAIGQFITIDGISFQVVGVSKYDGEVRRLQEADEVIFTPLSGLMNSFGDGKHISWFVCTAAPSIPVSSIETKVKRLLANRHQVSPEDDQAIGSFNLEREYQRLASLFSSIRIFLWIVGIGTLMAGVVSVSNVMLIAVKDRTREIGVRKALGATPWSIISLILLESVFITTLSGYVGLLLGTAIVALINLAVGTEGEMFNNPEISLGVSLGSLIVLIISGALAGLLPALHAARIKPVEALRSE
ncbi:MAG: ABC transporter permease [Aureispira sp.]|nr:ABC transporter permease [Aureispira sp.]